jgi:hypothetical protein
MWVPAVTGLVLLVGFGFSGSDDGRPVNAELVAEIPVKTVRLEEIAEAIKMELTNSSNPSRKDEQKKRMGVVVCGNALVLNTYVYEDHT